MTNENQQGLIPQNPRNKEGSKESEITSSKYRGEYPSSAFLFHPPFLQGVLRDGANGLEE